MQSAPDGAYMHFAKCYLNRLPSRMINRNQMVFCWWQKRTVERGAAHMIISG